VQDAIKKRSSARRRILYGHFPKRGGREPYLVESPVLMTVTPLPTRACVRVRGSKARTLRSSSTIAAPGIFDAMTSENVGRRLAIVLDKTVYSAPVIKERIPRRHVQITGRFSMDDAHDLAIVLRSARCRPRSKSKRSAPSVRRSAAIRFARARCHS